MKIGFTGTRNEPTSAQLTSLRDLLRDRYARESGPPSRREFHDGDCVGSDEVAHAVANGLGYWMVQHPPMNPDKRAFCEADEVRPAKSYFARNRDIVDETDELVATPWHMKEPSEKEGAGGTWYTIWYAQKKGKMVTIIWPDGSLSFTP